MEQTCMKKSLKDDFESELAGGLAKRWQTTHAN